jgi:hypothetical protein
MAAVADAKRFLYLHDQNLVDDDPAALLSGVVHNVEQLRSYIQRLHTQSLLPPEAYTQMMSFIE